MVLLETALLMVVILSDPISGNRSYRLVASSGHKKQDISTPIEYSVAVESKLVLSCRRDRSFSVSMDIPLNYIHFEFREDDELQEQKDQFG